MLSLAEDEAPVEERIDVAKADDVTELEVDRAIEEEGTGAAVDDAGRVLLVSLGESSSGSEGQFVAVGKMEVIVLVPYCVCSIV